MAVSCWRHELKDHLEAIVDLQAVPSEALMRSDDTLHVGTELDAVSSSLASNLPRGYPASWLPHLVVAHYDFHSSALTSALLIHSFLGFSFLASLPLLLSPAVPTLLSKA